MKDFDYFVLCADRDEFLMKSECDKLGLKYIDFFSELVKDMDDEEIEVMLYGQGY